MINLLEKSFFRMRGSFVAIAVLVVFFCLQKAHANKISEWDKTLYDQIHHGWKCDFGDVVFPVISDLGGGEVYLSVNLGMAVFGTDEHREGAKLATTALAAGMLSALALKCAIGRERPPGFERPRYDSSFPSGHTTAAFAMAYVYGDQYPKLRIPLYIAAASVGISRIYVGEHYPSDVLAGAVLGTLAGLVVAENKSFVLSIGF